MLRQLLSDQDNCVKVTDLYLKMIDVKITSETVEQQLSYHPDYPSLLSICDLFNSYGIDNLALRVEADSLDKTPTPFITQINGNEGYPLFTIVKAVNGDSVELYDFEKLKWTLSSRQDFSKKWKSKIVLLTESEQAKSENEYDKKKAAHHFEKIRSVLTLSILPVIIIGFALLNLVTYGIAAAIPTLLTILYLSGCLLTGLLLWYEVDQHNPFLKQICNSGKKVNCKAILNSKASSVAGVSWSIIGFTYFSGGLLLSLYYGLFNIKINSTLLLFSLLAIPYVFFSVYYQWRIAKQWCVLCMSVQILLCVQTLLLLRLNSLQYVNLSTFSFEMILSIALSYCIPFVMLSYFLSAKKEAKENKSTKVELERLKHNPSIFESLLTKQPLISDDSHGLGIILGNPNASQRIVKVCNPYCGPCAQAHLPMEELLENNPDLQIQIIFTATTNKSDRSYAPVSHLLAIAENADERNIKNALDTWYLQDKKDYDVFANQFPIQQELDKQDMKIDAMSKWCDQAEIRFTPTFFFNGRQLPSIYSVTDLKYFLTA